MMVHSGRQMLRILRAHPRRRREEPHPPALAGYPSVQRTHGFGVLSTQWAQPHHATVG